MSLGGNDVQTRLVITALDQTGAALANLQRSLRGVQGEVRTLNAENEALNDASTRVNSANLRTADSFTRIAGAATVMRGAIAALGLGLVARELMQTAQASERMQNSMEAATGSAAMGAADLAFVRREANRLGIDLVVAADGYTKLAAAAKGTALEGEPARRVFSSVAESARAMGLSGEEMKGMLTAITQMMSKGTVQAEELRGQLSERFPPALGVAARALGVTTDKLDDMLKKGQVIAEDFLPKFAAQMQKEFPATEKSLHGLTAETELLKNKFFDLKNEIMERGGTSLFSAIIRETRELVDEFTRLYRTLDSTGTKKFAVISPGLAYLAAYGTGAMQQYGTPPDYNNVQNVRPDTFLNDPSRTKKPTPQKWDKQEQFDRAALEMAFGIKESNENLDEFDRKLLSIQKKAAEWRREFGNKPEIASWQAAQESKVNQDRQIDTASDTYRWQSAEQDALRKQAEEERNLAILRAQLSNDTLAVKLLNLQKEEEAATWAYAKSAETEEEFEARSEEVRQVFEERRLQALYDEQLKEAEIRSKWAAKREEDRREEEQAQMAHLQRMTQMQAETAAAAAGFTGDVGDQLTAMEMRHQAERDALITQTTWKLENVAMEENERRRLIEETNAQITQMDQQAAIDRANTWWNSAQTYMNYAQQMTTMALQLALFEEGQKGQIGKRMLAMTIRFAAQEVQQYMFTQAKKHLLAAFGAQGQATMMATQHVASLTMLETEALAWESFFYALSLNPYGGQAVLGALAAMGVVSTEVIPAAIGAIGTEAAGFSWGEMGLAAAWGAGGIAVGALGEAGAGAVDGSGSSGTYGGGVGGVVTQPVPQGGQQAGPSITIVLKGSPMGKWIEEELIPGLNAAGNRNVRIEYAT